MSRVLVSGASGFVGANLVRRLGEEAREIHLLVRAGFRSWRLDDVITRFEFHTVAPGRRVADIVREVRPQWIFNLAAYGAYPSQSDTTRMIETNFGLTVELLESALAAGFDAFIHAGSSSEYGFMDHAPREDEPLLPNSPYGVSKAAASMYCAMAARRDHANIKVFRLYSIYGPWEEPSRFIPQLLTHTMRGAWPPLAAPRTARDFLYVDDAVGAFMAGVSPHGAGEIFNVGSGTQHSLESVVDIVRHLTRVPAVPRWMTMPSRSWDTECWISDSTKIRESLGWSATTSLREGLGRTVRWLESQSGAVRERYMARDGTSPGSTP